MQNEMVRFGCFVAGRPAPGLAPPRLSFFISFFFFVADESKLAHRNAPSAGYEIEYSFAGCWFVACVNEYAELAVGQYVFLPAVDEGVGA